MAEFIPEQNVHYSGFITDTSRWQNFEHRPDDIFICTPPKCGTTWTQAICAMLVTGKVDHGTQSSMESPWVDAQFAPIEEYLKHIDAQENRRYLKTHTPMGGIPYISDCTYLVIIRDPRDAYCSGLNHRDNMSDQELALATFPSGETPFADWLNYDLDKSNWDRQALTHFVHFYLSYWRIRDLPNVHLFHYSDMKQNLKGAISDMAAALNIQVAESLVSEMAEAATFDNMKNKAEQFAPESGSEFWKQDSGFFANGRNAQWKTTLSESDLLAFDAKIEELLEPDTIQWLFNRAD